MRSAEQIVRTKEQNIHSHGYETSGKKVFERFRHKWTFNIKTDSR